MNPRHDRILSHLSKVAWDLADTQRAKLCAAIVLKNEIISLGVNRLKTDPFQKRFGKTPYSIYLHAEIAAIKNAIKRLNAGDLSKATLYVARVKSVKDSVVYGLAKPCSGCQRAIAEFGIKQVIFTNEEESNYSFL